MIPRGSHRGPDGTRAAVPPATAVAGVAFSPASAPPTGWASETAARSSPPNAAIGQSLKTCAETSTTKAAIAIAIRVAPDIALTK